MKCQQDGNSSETLWMLESSPFVEKKALELALIIFVRRTEFGLYLVFLSFLEHLCSFLFFCLFLRERIQFGILSSGCDVFLLAWFSILADTENEKFKTISEVLAKHYEEFGRNYFSRFSSFDFVFCFIFFCLFFSPSGQLPNENEKEKQRKKGKKEKRKKETERKKKKKKK